MPGDVSVVSFDGSELAAWLRPRLTSVALPFQAMGTLAVEHLLSPDRSTVGVSRLPLAVEIGGSVRGDHQ